MFKITLPCSGSVTDEVDVQVLINITGYVEAEPDLLATSAAEQPLSGSAGEQSTNLSSQSDQMQSDQAATDSGAQKLRLVTHSLAIKRKKICTQHPVQVDQPARRPIRIDHWQPPLAPPAHTLAPTLRPPTSAVGPELASAGLQTVSGFGRQVWPSLAAFGPER